MVDPKLVATILRDRSPYGWTETDAAGLAERYETWLADLKALGGQRPPLTPRGRAALSNLFDKTLLRAGRGAALYSAQGRGKTNALAHLTALALRYRPEWEVYTNVPYPWWAGIGEKPPRLHLVETLSELLRALSERTLRAGWSAVLIDEFDQTDSSHSWATDASESWAKYLFVARHYMTRGPLVVFHSFSWIPKTIRGGSVGSPFKLVVQNGQRRIGDLENPKGDWVGVIPESDLPFLTFGLRGFKIDVDVQELEAQFIGPQFAGDVEAVARTTLEYLGRPARVTPEQVRETQAQRREQDLAAAEGRRLRERLIADDLVAGMKPADVMRKWGTSGRLIRRIRDALLLDSKGQSSTPAARELHARERSATSTRPDENEGVCVDPGSTT